MDMKASRLHVRWSNEDEAVLLLRGVLSAYEAGDDDALDEAMAEVLEFLNSEGDGE